MPSRPRRKHVDPVRVHVITLAVFGVIAGVALAIWTFPKFFLGLLLLGASAVVYLRIYAFIEARLEAEEGRLAEELGFDLQEEEDDAELTLDDDGVPARRAKPRRRRKPSEFAREARGAGAGGEPAKAAAPPEADAPADTEPAAATAEGKA